MDKKVFRSYMLLIVFTLSLVVALIKIDEIGGFLGSLLSLMSPFFIGFAIAFVLNMPYQYMVGWFERLLPKKTSQKIAKPAAMALSYVLCIGFLCVVISVVIPALVNSVAMLVNNIGDYLANLEEFILWATKSLQLENVDVAGLLGSLEAEIKQIINTMVNAASTLFPQLFSFTTGLVTAMANWIIGLVLSIYMLSSRDVLKKQGEDIVSAFFPERIVEKILSIGRLTSECFTQFISGQLIEACVLGGLCFIGMSIFGFEYAFLISVLIGVTALIPVIGAFIGAIPAVFLLFMIEPMKAVWFIVFIVVLQQLEGNIIYPRVVGDKLGLPAIWVMMAILVGGGLFGVVGILMGVPLMTVAYKLITESAAKKLVNRKAEV